MFVNIGQQLGNDDAVVCLNFYLPILSFLGYVMNTKIVPNLVILVPTKFQLHWNFVPQVMSKMVHLCFLKNSKTEEQRMNLST